VIGPRAHTGPVRSIGRRRVRWCLHVIRVYNTIIQQNRNKP
jgi:hypothetical protein